MAKVYWLTCRTTTHTHLQSGPRYAPPSYTVIGCGLTCTRTKYRLFQRFHTFCPRANRCLEQPIRRFPCHWVYNNLDTVLPLTPTLTSPSLSLEKSGVIGGRGTVVRRGEEEVGPPDRWPAWDSDKCRARKSIRGHHLPPSSSCPPPGQCGPQEKTKNTNKITQSHKKVNFCCCPF